MSKSTVELLSYLEDHPEKIKEHLDRLYDLLSDTENKLQALELLSYEFTTEKETFFLECFEDSDELVRVQAADFLASSSMDSTLQKLQNHIINDASYLVRGYAINSFFSVFQAVYNSQEGLDPFLSKLLEEEKNHWVRGVIYARLYLLGKLEYLDPLLALLNDPNYLVKISALNGLEEVLSSDNASTIKNVLLDTQTKEENQVISIKERIQSLLEEIDGVHI